MKQSYFIAAYLVAVLICSVGNTTIERSQELKTIQTVQNNI